MIFSFQYKEKVKVASSKCLIQRRSCLNSLDKENMIKTNKVACMKEMGYLAAAKLYNMPRSTLCDYADSYWDPYQATQSNFGRKFIIPPALE